nr:DUF89 family protein [Candidatus Omnitrophota bacterium]
MLDWQDKPWIKIISAVLVIAFLTYDIAWATDFSSTSQQKQYASRSLFKNKKVDQNTISSQNEQSLETIKDTISHKKNINAKDSIYHKDSSDSLKASYINDIANIYIPDTLGKVIDSYSSPDSKGTIIHIQDLHTNPEASFNMAGILEILIKDYNLNLVCSEGATGVVDTSSVSSFPDKEVREKVAKLFVNSGELTGEEYISITKYPNLPIWGIEDKDTYFQHIVEFNKIMKFSKDALTFTNQVKEALNKLKPKIYSKTLLNLDSKEIEYEESRIDANTYLDYLLCSRPGLDISNYQNIVIFRDSLEAEKIIDQKKITQQSQDLLESLQSLLKDKDNKSEIESLSTKAVLYKDKKISPFSFYSYLDELSRRHLKEEIDKYPDLFGYISYLRKLNSLDSSKLFSEIEELAYEIKDLMSDNPDQKLLTKALRNVNFLENFFNLKISNENLDYYLKDKDNFKVIFFKDFLQPNLAKYNIDSFIDFNPDLIDKNLPILENFYELAHKRDLAMFNNATSEIETRKPKLTALITGGFHTQGLTKLLKDNNYSYIVISPYSKTAIDEENYRNLLEGKRKPLKELMSELNEKLRAPMGFVNKEFLKDFEKELGSIEFLPDRFIIMLVAIAIKLKKLPIDKIESMFTAEFRKHLVDDITIKEDKEGNTSVRYNNQYIRVAKEDAIEKLNKPEFESIVTARQTIHIKPVETKQPELLFGDEINSLIARDIRLEIFFDGEQNRVTSFEEALASPVIDDKYTINATAEPLDELNTALGLFKDMGYSLSDLVKDAEIAVLAPGQTLVEAKELLHREPGIKTIHIVEIDRDNFSLIFEEWLKLSPEERRRITLHRADACSMPFDNGRFAIVYAAGIGTDVLGDKKTIELLKEIHRVLMPNGFIIGNIMLSETKSLEQIGFTSNGGIITDPSFIVYAQRVPSEEEAPLSTDLGASKIKHGTGTAPSSAESGAKFNWQLLETEIAGLASPQEQYRYFRTYPASSVLGALELNNEDIYLDLAGGPGTYTLAAATSYNVKQAIYLDISRGNLLLAEHLLRNTSNMTTEERNGLLDKAAGQTNVATILQNVSRREVVEHSLPENVNILLGDARNMRGKIEDDSITKLSVTELFNWLGGEEGVKQCIGEMLRMVKAGGRIFIVYDVTNKEKLSDFEKTFKTIAEEQGIRIDFQKDIKTGIDGAFIVNIIDKGEIKLAGEQQPVQLSLWDAASNAAQQPQSQRSVYIDKENNVVLQLKDGKTLTLGNVQRPNFIFNQKIIRWAYVQRILDLTVDRWLILANQAKSLYEYARESNEYVRRDIGNRSRSLVASMYRRNKPYVTGIKEIEAMIESWCEKNAVELPGGWAENKNKKKEQKAAYLTAQVKTWFAVALQEDDPRLVYRLFDAKIDITGLPFWNLPIFPVTEKGEIDTELMDWMIKTTKPPEEYLTARKVSLEDLTIGSFITSENDAERKEAAQILKAFAETRLLPFRKYFKTVSSASENIGEIDYITIAVNDGIYDIAKRFGTDVKEETEQGVLVIKTAYGIEIIQPIEGHPGSQKLVSFLEKRENSAAVYYIALGTREIEKTLASINQIIPSALIIDKTSRTNSVGDKIAFIHPKATQFRTLVELIEYKNKGISDLAAEQQTQGLGAMGKFFVRDATYDESRAQLIAAVIDMDRPQVMQERIRIQAQRAPPQLINKALQELRAMTNDRIIRTVIDWYLDKFQKNGQILILEDNKKSILGIGTRNIIAVSRHLIDNPVALLHEIMHAYFDAHPRNLAALERYLAKGRVKWVKSKDPLLRAHYAIRAFQRQVLGDTDKYLTELIGKLEVARGLVKQGELFTLGDNKLKIEDLLPLAEALENALGNIDDERARSMVANGLSIDSGEYGIDNPEGHLLDLVIRDNNGKQVAALKVYPLKLADGISYDKDSVFLEWLGIEPLWMKGKGQCGPKLYDALLKLLSGLGYSHIYGVVNPGSEDFWEKMGWKDSDREIYISGSVDYYSQEPNFIKGRLPVVTPLSGASFKKISPHHASWANVKTAYEGRYYHEEKMTLSSGRHVDASLIDLLHKRGKEAVKGAAIDIGGDVFSVIDIDGQKMLVSRDIMDTLSDGEFLAVLSKALSSTGFNAHRSDAPLIISSLASSPRMFEDCLMNGFVGINKTFLDFYNDHKGDILKKKYLQILLQVGLEHELRHEMGETDEFGLEKIDAKRITELCNTERINIIDFMEFLKENRIINKEFEQIIQDAIAGSEELKITAQIQQAALNTKLIAIDFGGTLTPTDTNIIPVDDFIERCLVAMDLLLFADSELNIHIISGGAAKEYIDQVIDLFPSRFHMLRTSKKFRVDERVSDKGQQVQEILHEANLPESAVIAIGNNEESDSPMALKEGHFVRVYPHTRSMYPSALDVLGCILEVKGKLVITGRMAANLEGKVKNVHSTWAHNEGLFNGEHHDSKDMIMPDIGLVTRDLILKLRNKESGQDSFIAMQINGQEILVSKDIKNAIDEFDGAPSKADGAFLALLAKALSAVGFEKTKDGKPLIITSLSKSPRLFEDCLQNGFIGINQALLELYNNNPDQRQYLKILLQVGLEHELRHEFTGKHGKDIEWEFSQIDAKRIVELCKAVDVNLEGLIAYLKDKKIIEERFEKLIRLTESAQENIKQYRENRLGFSSILPGRNVEAVLEFIEKDLECYIAYGDMFKTSVLNKAFTMEIVTKLIFSAIDISDMVLSKYGGGIVRSGGDESIIVLPSSLTPTQVNNIRLELQYTISEFISDRYGFVKINGVNDKNFTEAYDVLNKNIRSLEGVYKERDGFFLVFDRTKKHSHDLNEACSEVLNMLNDTLKQNRLDITIIQDNTKKPIIMQSPRINFGIVKLKNVSKETIHSDFGKALRHGEYIKAIAKDELGLHGATEDLLIEHDNFDKEINQPSANKLSTDDRKAIAKSYNEKGLNLYFNQIEENYPVVKREWLLHTLQQMSTVFIGTTVLVRGPPDNFYIVTKLQDSSVILMKIELVYEPYGEMKERIDRLIGEAEKTGKTIDDILRQRWINGNGFKIINEYAQDEPDHSRGDRVIYAEAEQLYKILEDEKSKGLPAFSNLEILADDISKRISTTIQSEASVNVKVILGAVKINQDTLANADRIEANIDNVDELTKWAQQKDPGNPTNIVNVYDEGVGDTLIEAKWADGRDKERAKFTTILGSYYKEPALNELDINSYALPISAEIQERFLHFLKDTFIEGIFVTFDEIRKQMSEELKAEIPEGLLKRILEDLSRTSSVTKLTIKRKKGYHLLNLERFTNEHPIGREIWGTRFFPYTQSGILDIMRSGHWTFLPRNVRGYYLKDKYLLNLGLKEQALVDLFIESYIKMARSLTEAQRKVMPEAFREEHGGQFVDEFLSEKNLKELWKVRKRIIDSFSNPEELPADVKDLNEANFIETFSALRSNPEAVKTILAELDMAFQTLRQEIPLVKTCKDRDILARNFENAMHITINQLMALQYKTSPDKDVLFYNDMIHFYTEIFAIVYEPTYASKPTFVIYYVAERLRQEIFGEADFYKKEKDRATEAALKIFPKFYNSFAHILHWDIPETGPGETLEGSLIGLYAEGIRLNTMELFKAYLKGKKTIPIVKEVLDRYENNFLKAEISRHLLVLLSMHNSLSRLSLICAAVNAMDLGDPRFQKEAQEQGFDESKWLIDKIGEMIVKDFQKNHINEFFEIVATAYLEFEIKKKEKGWKENPDNSSQKINDNERPEIIILTDNAGEVVFDMLLAEYLLGLGFNVVIASRDVNVINDMTKKDTSGLVARMREMGYFKRYNPSRLKVISSGSKIFGTSVSDIEPGSDFLKEYSNKNTVCVIAKGQGNAESLWQGKWSKPFVHILTSKEPEKVLDFTTVPKHSALLLVNPPEKEKIIEEKEDIDIETIHLINHPEFISALKASGRQITIQNSGNIHLYVEEIRKPDDFMECFDGDNIILDASKGPIYLGKVKIGAESHIRAEDGDVIIRSGAEIGEKCVITDSKIISAEIKDGEIVTRRTVDIDDQGKQRRFRRMPMTPILQPEEIIKLELEPLSIHKSRRKSLEAKGVKITGDPSTIYIDKGVEIDSGVVIGSNVILDGATKIRKNAKIGSYTCLIDSEVSEGVQLARLNASDCIFHPGLNIAGVEALLDEEVYTYAAVPEGSESTGFIINPELEKGEKGIIGVRVKRKDAKSSRYSILAGKEKQNHLTFAEIRKQHGYLIDILLQHVALSIDKAQNLLVEFNEDRVIDDKLKSKILDTITMIMDSSMVDNLTLREVQVLIWQIIWVYARSPFQIEKKKADEEALFFTRDLIETLDKTPDSAKRLELAIKVATLSNISIFDKNDGNEKNPIEQNFNLILSPISDGMKTGKLLDLINDVGHIKMDGTKDIVDRLLKTPEPERWDKTVLFNLNNAGEVVYMLVLAREVLKLGYKVVLAVNPAPLDDNYDIVDLKLLLEEPKIKEKEFLGQYLAFDRIKVISNHPSSIGLDLGNTDREFFETAKDKNTTMMISIGYALTLAAFTERLILDAAYMCYVKRPNAFKDAGLELEYGEGVICFVKKGDVISVPEKRFTETIGDGQQVLRSAI